MTASRRRFLGIIAGSAAMLAGADAWARPYRWAGRALGAEVSLTLAHRDRAAAEAAVAACLDEIERLESLFSLYRPDSALRRLNRTGHLEDPGHDMVRLLGQAQAMARLTGGAFDVTMQPLWQLHAAGPPDAEAIRNCLRRVGHAGLAVSPRRVALARPGMALSLNGIAQGYITDRITELLRRRGFGHALIDLGEHRVTGPKDTDGTPWRLRESGGRILTLTGGAVATSAGSGTVFEPSGRRHHILDPREGVSPLRHQSVTVTAPSATLADALSTAFYVLDEKQARSIQARLSGVDVSFVRA